MRTICGLTACGALCVFVACGGSSAPPTSPSTGTPSTPATVAGCELTTSTSGSPVPGPGGPYTHNLAMATSSDGVTVQGLAKVLSHGSVPDGVRLPDGRIGVYYVNGETGGVWLARVSGSSITPVSPITIDGVFRPEGVVDPDAVAINGRVRLAYLNGFGPPGSGRRAMCLAESSDGITFQTLAMAYDVGTNQQQTDPSIVRLPNGTWLMAFRDDNVVRLARSSTGLSFTPYSQENFLGVVELGLTADGRVRMYTCQQGISSYVSADSGTTWTSEAVVIFGPSLSGELAGQGICDPSWVPDANLFFFKTG